MKNAILLLFMSLPALFAAQPEFDRNDVVRQVREHHSTARPGDHSAAGVDDGEFMIDTSIVLASPCDQDVEVSVAFDGANFFLAWSDPRRPGFCDIYGARVTPDGVLLDTSGIAIYVHDNGGTCDAVSFDGTNFLVVWSSRREASLDIFGARVTRSGVLLDTVEIPISTAPSSQFDAAVAFDGTNYLVVWYDERDAENSIRGVRLTPQGGILDTAGIIVTTSSYYNAHPALGFDGTNYLAVWEDGRRADGEDIYCARITPEGQVLDSAGLAVSIDSFERCRPALVFGDSNWLVVWEDQRTGGDHDLYGARVTRQGQVLDPTGIAISRDVDSDQSPALAYDGTNYLALWKAGTGGGILGARVTLQGLVLDTLGVGASRRWASVGLAFGDSTYLAAWTGHGVHAARISPGGAVVDSTAFPVDLTANRQSRPIAGYDGTNYFVVWQDSRDNGDSVDLYGARVTPQGAVLDPSGFRISAARNSVTLSAVAFDSTNYLVVWTLSDGIRGARVTPQGQVLDTSAIVIYPSDTITGGGATALFGGGVFLVVAHRPYGQTYFVRVAPDGTVLDTNAIPVVAGSESVIAFDGTNFLVAGATDWTTNGIWGSRVTRGGLVLDPNGFRLVEPGGIVWPAIAFDGTNYLVAWTYSGGSVLGRRVTTRGVWLDLQPISISTTADNPSGICAVFDGVNYVLVWRSVHNDGSAYGDSARIWGARVSPAGIVLDTSLLATLAINQTAGLTLTHGSGDEALLAYTYWTGHAGGKRYDADRIWGKLGPFGGVAEGGSLSAGKPLSLEVAPNPVTQPVNPSISYSLPVPGPVSLKLYDVAGKLLATLAQGYHPVGSFHRSLLPAHYSLASGVYLLRLDDAGAHATRKLVIE